MQGEQQAVETIDIMYNTDYGGFILSEDAVRMYCEAKGLDYAKEGLRLTWNVSRTDPVMVQIVKNLDLAAGKKHSKVGIWTISEKFQNYYSMDEYDGAESVVIDFKGYKLDQIRAALEEIPHVFDSAEPDQRYIVDKIREAVEMEENDEHEEYSYAREL